MFIYLFFIVKTVSHKSSMLIDGTFFYDLIDIQGPNLKKKSTYL